MKYDISDPKIRLKFDHSLRVAGLCEQIAATVPGADEGLARRIGLFHDIGRFEQVRRYHTFIDAKSVDHAGLGADLLFREGLVEQIEGPELTARERRIFELSVRYHSAYRLPEGLSAEEKMYCEILRDADKVDIFRVLCDTPPEEIYDVPAERMRQAAVTEEVKECFRERHAVLRSLKKTPVDNIVGHICLYFELVYPESQRLAREQGYLDRLLAFRSEEAETARWFEFMREKIYE